MRKDLKIEFMEKLHMLKKIGLIRFPAVTSMLIILQECRQVSKKLIQNFIILINEFYQPTGVPVLL